MNIRLAFFDDHPLLLAGMASHFAGISGFSVVESGSGPDEARACALNREVDVIVMDLGMPGNVLGAITAISTQPNAPALLIFTASAAVNNAIVALEAGAQGYVLKGSSGEDLATAIRTVHAGDTYITPSFAAKVVTGLRSAAQVQNQTKVKFSLREEQVLRLLLGGATNRGMAQKLAISEKTVKHYMSMLMQKLQVRNRIEVVLAAQELEKSKAGAYLKGLS